MRGGEERARKLPPLTMDPKDSLVLAPVLSDGNANLNSGRWDEEETIRLRNALAVYGPGDWKAMAKVVGTRTAAQCKDKYRVHLQYDGKQIVVGSFTPMEDEALREILKTHGPENWDHIASMLPGRTRQQCKSRWYRYLKPKRVDETDEKINVGAFSAEENDRLAQGVEQLGAGHWFEIAKVVRTRTPLQCKDRWRVIQQHVAPKDKGLPGFSREEDALLIHAVEKRGTSLWSRTAELVPGRSASWCRRRWHSELKYQGRLEKSSGVFREEEDERLRAAIAQCGNVVNWTQVAKSVGTRLPEQCKRRWAYLKSHIGGMALEEIEQAAHQKKDVDLLHLSVGKDDSITSELLGKLPGLVPPAKKRKPNDPE